MVIHRQRQIFWPAVYTPEKKNSATECEDVVSFLNTHQRRVFNIYIYIITEEDLSKNVNVKTHLFQGQSAPSSVQ